MPETTSQHGTTARYAAGCRCALCKQASADAHRAWREEHYGKTEPPTHGASGYVNYGCRCDVCREGHRQAMRRRRERSRANS